MKNNRVKSDRNKNSRNVRADRKNDPVIIINVNWEDLAHKSDDEIRSLSDRLNKNLRLARTKRDDKSSKIIESEICYIQREVIQRIKRRKSHENFSRK